MKSVVIVTVKEKKGLDYDVELPMNVPVSQLVKDIAEVINTYNEKKVLPQDGYALYCERMGKVLPGNKTLMELGIWNGDILVLQLSAAGDNPLLKVVPPADRRGAQMKAPSERAPRGKYAGGVLE